MARKKLSAEEIVERVSELETWVTQDVFLKKRFNFENFAEALDFVNRVGAVAERLDHHPDIAFGWGYAEFSVTTHDTGGLTQNDFDLAKKIEEISTEIRLISSKNMNSNKQFLQNLYDAFNRREIETIISAMHPDVKWANGLEGGFVRGRDAVREYWTDQFKQIQPELEILKFETDEQNRNVVTVHQIVKDLEGNVLADGAIHQIFTIEDGLISLYEIGETETIQERIEKNRAANE